MDAALLGNFYAMVEVKSSTADDSDEEVPVLTSQGADAWQMLMIVA